MRHRKKTIKLGRHQGSRRALLDNLTTSLVLYEKIRTTEAKAKALKPLVERIVTRGKENSLHTKQQLTSKLHDTKAVYKVLRVLGPRYKDRKGGYTRVIKLAPRKGDGARMVQIEFV